MKQSSSSFSYKSPAVLPYETPNFYDHYRMDKSLSKGQVGTTYLCIDKSEGKEYACNIINKRRLIRGESYNAVWQEIQIMHHLSGHPNIVRIKGTYEDDNFVHLVMELCTGGDLYDGIALKGRYPERKAAHLMKTIVDVVEECHSLGVMHRDLKLENFLFASRDEDAALKATGFGISLFYKPGDVFSEKVGSWNYMAPEVWSASYGPQSDIWSAGVILYILLSGFPPFGAETEMGIMRQTLNGPLDFESEPWPCISDSAKHLIRNMLNREPKKRFTAHEVLCHPWIVDGGTAPDKPLYSAVLSRLKQFSAMNMLKKMALRVIAEKLLAEETGGLKRLFGMIAMPYSSGYNNISFGFENCGGTITYDDLKVGLERVGCKLMESEIHALMDAADMDNSGTIDCGKFLAATLHVNKLEREENLRNAFSFFDKDGSGYITIDELSQVCRHFGLGEGHLEDMMKQTDQNDDWRIDYGEFETMMKKGTGGDGGSNKLKMLLNQSELSNFRDKWSSLEVSYLDIKKATGGFNESSKIGSGGYGSVYKGKLGGTMVAIKMLDSSSKQGLNEFSQELEVLYGMRHQNLVKLIGACFDVCALVYEYLPNGSLEDSLEYSPNLLTWQMRTRIIYEICSALIYLHSRSVVHGDLKPANILLDANFKSKLSDFGLCRFLPKDMTTSVFLETVPKGTSGYIDPWFFETSILRPGSDLFSFGITILKLLTRLPPVGLGRKARDVDENSFREMIDPTAGSWPFDLAKELLQWSLQCCYHNEKSSELLKDLSTCLEDMLAEIETPIGGNLKTVVAEGKKVAEDPLEVAEVEKKQEEKEEKKHMP